MSKKKTTYSEIIKKSDYLKCGIPDALSLEGGDLNYFTSERNYLSILDYKGHKIATLYGRFISLTDAKSVDKIEDVLHNFGPSTVIKVKQARVLENLGICKVLEGNMEKPTCGHKAELPVKVEADGKVLCPKCFIKQNPNAVIGRNCKLIYNVPF